MVHPFPGLSSRAYTARAPQTPVNQPQFGAGAKKLGSRTEAFRQEQGDWSSPDFSHHAGISKTTQLKVEADKVLSPLKVWEPHNGDATIQKIVAILQMYEIDPGLVDFSKMYEGAKGSSKVAAGAMDGATYGFVYLVKHFTWKKLKNEQKKQQLQNTGTYNSPLARPQLKKFPFAKGLKLNSAQIYTNKLANQSRDLMAAPTQEYDGYEYKIPLWDGKDCVLILRTSSQETAETLRQHYDDHISLVSAGIAKLPK